MTAVALESPTMLTLNVVRMRELRDALGLTQSQAAKRAGMNQSRWSDIESGERANVTLETLGIVASALGVPSAELLTETKRKPTKGAK